MEEIEKYKQLLVEKENEIINLKNEIEIYKRKLKLSKELVTNYDFFDKCYNPLRNEYKFIHQRLNYFFETMQELKKIYNARLLLNPTLNVKIRDEEKAKIINETRTVLHRCQINEIPPLKDFYINQKEGNFLAGYERTKLKKFVVKNNKN